MTDLLHVLPNFSTRDHTHLIPSLEKNSISVSDLLTLDPLEVAKKTQLPVLDLRRFTGLVTEALQQDLQFGLSGSIPACDPSSTDGGPAPDNALAPSESPTGRGFISLLDPALDAGLNGGIPTGYVTEITGESGVGKTQFLLTLLLSAQLSSTQGLGRSSIYISTEAPLSTKRLAQILENHPLLANLPASERPSLTRVRAIPVGDLEAQDHILEYQLPAAIQKFGVGLVVLDSVAANYRAEHGSAVPKDLADRATRLAKLGHLLRKLAVREKVAIVVANQVSDRLEKQATFASSIQYSSSPLMSSSPLGSQAAMPGMEDDCMTLDYQQKFFTGWGDATGLGSSLKTPALGLAWSNQIACRIALKMGKTYTDKPTFQQGADGRIVGGRSRIERKSRRYMKLVFAPWAAGHEEQPGVEYEISAGGIHSTRSDDDG